VERILLQRNREKMSLPRALIKKYLTCIYACNVAVKYQGGEITTKNDIGCKNILNNHQSYAKQIVPKNHELARKHLAEMIAKETSAFQSSETNTPSTFTPRQQRSKQFNQST
jgi:hypothetical protein